MTASIPREAVPHEAQDVLDVLWGCRDEITLKPELDLDSFLVWVRDHCANHRFFVVDVDGKIGGVMLVTPPHLGVSKGRGDELFYIAVRSEYRRRGITKSLLAFAKARWSALRAAAFEGNKVMRAILEREGFQEKPSTSFHWRNYEWRRAPAERRRSASSKTLCKKEQPR